MSNESNFSFINQFRNTDNETSESVLQDIRELEFAAIELNLYLDNHPKNKKALRDYNCVSNALMELKQYYDTKYGQLTHFGYSQSDEFPWTWTNSPWPWE